MFVKIVPNNKGRKNTSFIYFVESYRDNGKVKHRTIRDFSLFENNQVPYIKAAFMNPKPHLIYDDK